MQPPGSPNLLGPAISAARHARGWTQGEVVGRIPTYYRDERSYRRIESGERTPDRGTLVVVLARGLAIGDAVEINRILALAGYAPISADEMREFGLAASLSQATPAP